MAGSGAAGGLGAGLMFFTPAELRPGIEIVLEATKFAELVSKRQGFATILSVIVLTIFYGFFMVKAIDSDPNHYINFRCASLNQYANAVFSDVVPDVPIAKMSREQLMAFRNLTEAARGGFSPRMKEIEQHFPDIKLRRAALEVETASKKLPLSWAKAVVDTINKF